MKQINQITKIIDDCVKIFGSVTSLSEYLGVQRGTVSRWRSGKHSPSGIHLMRLQLVLKARNGK
jgi:transcriptional regulator with XRE-family HTH domain